MQIKLPYDSTKPIAGEASIEINKSIQDVFDFIGEHFFENYQKWAEEVVDLEPLTGNQVFIGAKAKQVRKDNGEAVESIFEIIDFQPYQLVFQGVTAPYKHSYVLENLQEAIPTRLTFRFELLELEIFMRP
ncbi:MAG: SRPBCC family protein, partial [Methylococcales bacterium]